MTTFLRTENILGCTHRYHSLGEGGAPAAIDITVPPGAGAPPHTHEHEDETFYGLEGEVTLLMEGLDAPVVLRAGDYVFAPRGKWHAFQNQGASTARMLVTVLPGANLVAMFSELAQVAMPPDPAVVGAITARYGVVLRG